jgi:hypothetical protein
MIQMTGIRDQRSEPPVRQNSPSFEDTTAPHGNTPSASRPSGSAEAMPPRSHNSLLYDVTSATHPGLPLKGLPFKGWFRGRILLRAAFSPAPLSVLLRKTPAGATGRYGVAVKAGAFTGGGGDRARTDDPLLAKQVLSQLSYTPSRDQASVIRHQNRSSDY